MSSNKYVSESSSCGDSFSEESPREESVFRILIATDNHLGYLEKDQIRGNDSFATFEEILQLALDHEVDFVLLGGDLFHDNKPSRKTLYKTLNLLRKYCLGKKEHDFLFESNEEEVFSHLEFPKLNYNNPHMSIALPIFSIHGNHDDPMGMSGLCSLDLLSTCGLINYFGKCNSIEQIEVKPLLFKKGSTQLAIYGLGNVRDERLFQMYKNDKVQLMHTPDNNQEHFNIMVVHQNRTKHGKNALLPEHFIDDIIDFVIWGHEHECLIDPQSSRSKDFYISQPGSSVATSLAAGESIAKKVGLLQVFEKSFKLDPIDLKSVRPFVFDEVHLSKCGLDKNNNKGVIEFLKQKVENMIKKSAEQKSQSSFIQPELPLIRLRVDHGGDGYSIVPNSVFSKYFTDKVANPHDILLFKKQIFTNEKEKSSTFKYSNEEQFELSDVSGMEVLIENYLKENECMNFSVLSKKLLINTLMSFVNKSEKDLISSNIDRYVSKMCSKINDPFDMDALKVQIGLVKSEIENDTEYLSDPYMKKTGKDACLQTTNTETNPEFEVSSKIKRKNQNKKSSIVQEETKPKKSKKAPKVNSISKVKAENIIKSESLEVKHDHHHSLNTSSKSISEFWKNFR